MDMCTYACDVGSTRPDSTGHVAFGWARAARCGESLHVSGATEIDSLIASLRKDAVSGARISLGMECPMYLPVPSGSHGLSRGRSREGARSCFAPAGGYVAILGLHQLAFILQALRSIDLTPTLDPFQWLRDEKAGSLLLWEAFVSGKAHWPTRTQSAGIRDSATAAVEFDSRMVANQLMSDVESCEGTSAFSLAGAALLWSGWTGNVSILAETVLVVRPDTPFGGKVDCMPL